MQSSGPVLTWTKKYMWRKPCALLGAAGAWCCSGLETSRVPGWCHWQLFSGNEQSIRNAVRSASWLTELHSIVSEVSRWGFTNQNVLRCLWSLESPQLRAVILCTYLDVCSCLLLATWHSHLALLLLTVFLGSLAASRQHRPSLCPPSLCPGSVWASVSSATVLQHPTGWISH